MDRYDRAWRSPGTAMLSELFALDASYLVGPWAGPVPSATLWEAEGELRTSGSASAVRSWQ